MVRWKQHKYLRLNYSFEKQSLSVTSWLFSDTFLCLFFYTLHSSIKMIKFWKAVETTTMALWVKQDEWEKFISLHITLVMSRTKEPLNRMCRTKFFSGFFFDQPGRWKSSTKIPLQQPKILSQWMKNSNIIKTFYLLCLMRISPRVFLFLDSFSFNFQEFNVKYTFSFVHLPSLCQQDFSIHRHKKVGKRNQNWNIFYGFCPRINCENKIRFCIEIIQEVHLQ